MEKELRVFVCSSQDEECTDLNYQDIDNWTAEENLPFEAVDFINNAEANGRVYSLGGFMNAFNLEEICSYNDYIFITDKY
jgi:hypothetical protein